MLVSYPDVLSPGGGLVARRCVGRSLAALRARDPARRDIGGWGRRRRGGAKVALVMIQLARRLLQPLPGIVAGLFGSCRALLPGDWGVLQH